MSCLETIHTLVEIAFFVVAGATALLGLRTWSRELRGRAEYDLARRVLTGAYRVRDRIRECQSPFSVAAEWRDFKPDPEESAERQGVSRSYFMYGHRFNRVLDALAAWESDVLEAEAVFGEGARGACQGISRIASELNAAIQSYHQSRWQGGEWTDADQRFRNIVHGAHPAMASGNAELRKKMDDGGFEERAVAAFNELEACFRPLVTQRAMRFGRRRLRPEP